MKAYFQDSSSRDALHAGELEHEEIEITAEELEKLKARARKAVSMFDSAAECSGFTPEEYKRFLGKYKKYSYADFFGG